MKITKKQIAIEYDCMMSVKGPYAEADKRILSAIAKAQEPTTEKTYTEINGITYSSEKIIDYGATTRKDIINRAYDLLNEQKNPAAVALGKMGGSVKSEKKSKSSAVNGALGGRPRKPAPE